MATLTVTATPEPSKSPPRVRIDITDAGSPEITSVSVIRLDAAGNAVPVRTLDGNALPLLTAGASRAGTVYDYEMPYGASVRYATSEQYTVTSAAVAVDSAVPWLVHPGAPARSLPIDLRVESFDEEEFAVNAGTFRPLGRENAVVVTDGRRKGGTGSFTVGTETLADIKAVKALIADAGVLFFNAPPLLGLGIDPCYLAVMDVRVRRLSNIGSASQRDVVMPYVVVDMPVGGSLSLYAWADVVANYPTWQDVINDNATWADLQLQS